MISGGSTPVDTARRLFASEMADAVGPDASAAAMHRVCVRISDNLRNVLGDDGYNALLARATSRARAEHPILTDVTRDGGPVVHFDAIAPAVAAHGVTAVGAALESLLAHLAGILGSLIGADMVLNLLDHNGPAPKADRNQEKQ